MTKLLTEQWSGLEIRLAVVLLESIRDACTTVSVAGRLLHRQPAHPFALSMYGSKIFRIRGVCTHHDYRACKYMLSVCSGTLLPRLKMLTALH